MTHSKKLALQRVGQAELSTLLKSQQNEGDDAQRAEYTLYRLYLSQNDTLTDPQRDLLAHLSLSGLPHRACFESGTPFRTYYAWREHSPEFREAINDAKLFASDRLERVAVDLATGVYTRPLVSQGRIAAYERIMDTKVLIALLKARKPQEFATRVDVTSNGHSLVKLIDKDTWDSV